MNESTLRGALALLAIPAFFALQGCAAYGAEEPDDEASTAVSEKNEEAEVDESADALVSAGTVSVHAAKPFDLVTSGMPKSPQSDAIISWLDSNGGWGTGKMRIDFGLTVLRADASTPKKTFSPTEDFYSPDCERVPFPVPAGGAIEGEDGYTCTTGGDCHLLVVEGRKLYEMWRADVSSSGFRGGCGVVWDLDKTYPENLRGDGCTSADAGGLPVAPLTFSADEVAAGEIRHAIRFILPNKRIRRQVYVPPATHSTNATRGGANAPPYGVRFRLRADFPLETLPTEGARVVARAMQKYGMLLADAGKVPLTAQSDRFTQHKWKDVGVNDRSLDKIRVTDMEVVDMENPVKWDGDCHRN